MLNPHRMVLLALAAGVTLGCAYVPPEGPNVAKMRLVLKTFADPETVEVGICQIDEYIVGGVGGKYSENDIVRVTPGRHVFNVVLGFRHGGDVFSEKFLVNLDFPSPGNYLLTVIHESGTRGVRFVLERLE